MSNILNRIRRLEQALAEDRAGELAVDPRLARRCLAQAVGDLHYLAGSMTVGTAKGFDPHAWDGDPATFPEGPRATAASRCAGQLAKALGVEEVARLGWHPNYIQAARIRPAGPREWALLERAMDSADPNLAALAELTAAFLQPD
jgi:hypothetical protein